MNTDDQRTVWLFTGTAIALGALVVFAGIRPSSVNWGVHLLGFLSPGAVLVTCGLLLLSLIPAFQTFLISISASALAWVNGRTRYGRRAIGAAALCAAGLMFWWMRQQTYFLGDGYLVIRTLDMLGRTGDIPASFPTAPLSAALAWLAMRAAGLLHTGQPALLAWQAVSVGAGVVTLGAIGFISGLLWKDPAERVAGFLLLAGAGAAQLMFGYVETYPAAYAVLWVYVAVALRSLRGGFHAAVPATVYALLCLFHVGMAIFLPSLMYLLFRAYRRNGWRKTVASLLPPVAVTIGLLWLMQYGPARLIATAVRDGAHYVPLAAFNAWEDPYTLFSVWHIADVMNLFMLLAPFSLLMIGAFLVSAVLPRNARPGEGGFWYALGIPAALWLFMNSFELGLSRDWDLAASFGMMVTAGALVIWHAMTQEGPGRRRVMMLMAVFTLSCTGGWISINADADHAIARFTRLLDNRLWSGSALADANEELGGYYRDHGAQAEAAEQFARSVTLDSTNARRWIRLAGTVAELGDAPSALRAYERALALGTRDPMAYLNTGILLHAVGRTPEGIARVRECIAMDSTSAPGALTLGTLLMQQGGDDREALAWLRKAMLLDPSSRDARLRAEALQQRISSSH